MLGGLVIPAFKPALGIGYELLDPLLLAFLANQQHIALLGYDHILYALYHR